MARQATVRCFLVAVVAGVCALVGPAPAAAPASTATGYLFIAGRGYTTPTRGRAVRLPAAGQTIESLYQSYPGGGHLLGITVSDKTRVGFAAFTLSAPNGGPIRPGTYRNFGNAATADRPELTIAGPAAAVTCHATDGSVVVDRAAFKGTTVKRFHATFRLYCDHGLQPVYGEVGIGVPRPRTGRKPPPLPVATLTIDSDPDDGIAQGRDVKLVNLVDGDFGFAYSNGQFVRFAIRERGMLLWSVELNAGYGHRLQPGAYEGAIRASSLRPNNTEPGLEVSAYSNGCTSVRGRFVVKAFSYAPVTASLRSVDATFEQHCGANAAALRGQISISVPPM